MQDKPIFQEGVSKSTPSLAFRKTKTILTL